MAKSVPNSAKCPVCGMTVEASCDGITVERDNLTYYFCSEVCKEEFEKKTPGKRKGWWGRYLERMEKSNRKAFGTSGPKCH
jgi:YHS domain-containing protein